MKRADALLISDLHLSAEQPRTVDAFVRFLADVPRQTNQLYILGDLFDYWAGDDGRDDPFVAFVIDRLRALTAAGVALHFMVGNRDFLIGPDFIDATGATLLDDPCCVRFGTHACVLSHGDALCTDDREYQAFRNMVREPAWRAAFLRRPLAERMAMVVDARGQSEASKLNKTTAIMDVNPVAVRRLLAESGVNILIHGHTHRPGKEDLLVEGRTCTRWVLPDWDGQVRPARGGGIRIDAAGPSFFGLDEAGE